MATIAENRKLRTAGLTVLLLAIAGSVTAQPRSAQQQPAPPPAPAQSAAAPSGAVASSLAPATQASPAPAATLSPEERRRADLLADADHLIQLAQQLKAEVDKTNEFTLSLKAIKKAEDIQSSAKSLSQRLEKK